MIASILKQQLMPPAQVRAYLLFSLYQGLTPLATIYHPRKRGFISSASLWLAGVETMALLLDANCSHAFIKLNLPLRASEIARKSEQ